MTSQDEAGPGTTAEARSLPRARDIKTVAPGLRAPAAAPAEPAAGVPDAPLATDLSAADEHGLRGRLTEAPSSPKQTARQPLERIRHRRDFLAAARARRQGTPSFLLQARARGDGGPPRVGFTCSRKVGNAVARNRARRRLREAARLVMPVHALAGWDYVLVGRAEATAARPFAQLQQDLRHALQRVHR